MYVLPSFTKRVYKDVRNDVICQFIRCNKIPTSFIPVILFVEPSFCIVGYVQYIGAIVSINVMRNINFIKLKYNERGKTNTFACQTTLLLYYDARDMKYWQFNFTFSLCNKGLQIIGGKYIIYIVYYGFFWKSPQFFSVFVVII